jgi:hypothetical protein
MKQLIEGGFEFKKPEPKQIVNRLRQIAKSEKVRVSEEKLKEIAKNAPSARSIPLFVPEFFLH